jgi:hypothetical protein
MVVAPSDDDGDESESSALNVTFGGCDGDDGASSDRSSWLLSAGLRNGCYSMVFSSCGSDGLLSLYTGELANWRTSNLEITCHGLPCTLAFCVASGLVMPEPTAKPTTRPTVSPVPTHTTPVPTLSQAPTPSCVDDIATERYASLRHYQMLTAWLTKLLFCRYCYHFAVGHNGAGSGSGLDDSSAGSGAGSGSGGDDDSAGSGAGGGSGDDGSAGSGAGGGSGDDGSAGGDTGSGSGDDADTDGIDGWSGGFEVVIRDPEARTVVLNETVGCDSDDAMAGDVSAWKLHSSLTDGCYVIQMATCGDGTGSASSSSTIGDLVEWMTSDLELACPASPCSLAFCANAGRVFGAPSRAPSSPPSSLAFPLPTTAPSISVTPTRGTPVLRPTPPPTSTVSAPPCVDDASAGLYVASSNAFPADLVVGHTHGLFHLCPEHQTPSLLSS